jgi:integrase
MAKLTTKFVNNIKPTNQINTYWDETLKGFGLCVRPSGKKTFLLKYRIGRGRRAAVRKQTIGTTSVITTERARLKAKEFLLIASQGKDPFEQSNKNTTINEFCDLYIERHAKIKKKESSMIEDQRMIKLQIIPHFGKLKVTDLTRAMVMKHHESLSETSHMANRFLALLSKMMNLAEKWEFRPLYSNPCKHVDRYKEEPRKIYLKMDELERVGSAMRELKDIESEYVLSAIQMLILTACRTGEILSLKWEYIDFENCCMNLPDTKTGERKIHLNPSALIILKSLEKKSDYVFVSRVQNKKITTIRLTWKKICKIAGLSDVRLHDPRHTFASHAVNNGYSLPIIAKILGHADIKTTERYAHLHQDPINKAIDDISLKIKKVMEL